MASKWHRAPMRGFKNCLLKDLGEIVGGATPSTKNESYYGGDIAWITPRDLSALRGRFVCKGERSLTKEGFDSCSVRLIPPYSVLFTSRAPIGYVAIAQNEVCTNQGFKSIVPNEGVDYLFLYYLLVNNRRRIESMGSGTTFKEISGSVMKNISVCVPTDIEEQRAISRILGSLDDKIENNMKINHQLEQMAQAIFKSWFVDFEPWGGVMPADWEKGTIGDIVRLQRGHDLPLSSVTPGEYPVIGSKGIIAYHNTFTSAAPVIVMGRSGNTGAPRYYNVDCWAHNTSLYSKKLFGAPLWVYYMLAKIDYSIYKGGSAVPTLNRNHVESYGIIIPPKRVQDSFHDAVEGFVKQRDELESQNASLAILRDTLLPRLMSGELSAGEIKLSNTLRKDSTAAKTEKRSSRRR